MTVKILNAIGSPIALLFLRLFTPFKIAIQTNLEFLATKEVLPAFPKQNRTIPMTPPYVLTRQLNQAFRPSLKFELPAPKPHTGEN